MKQTDAATRTELEASRETGLYTLAWATLELERLDLKIKAVTLRKYCIAGRYGRKLGGSWLLTMAEIRAIAAANPDTRRPGRPRK